MFSKDERTTWANSLKEVSGQVTAMPSRINRVFSVDDHLVVKLSGPIFRRGWRFYSPSRMLSHEASCLEALEGFDVAPKLLFYRKGMVIMSWCGHSIKDVAPPKDWLEQIGLIEEAFRACGLVHLDLKVANIVSDGQKLRVVDFGWSLLGGNGFRPRTPKASRFSSNGTMAMGEGTGEQLRRIISDVV